MSVDLRRLTGALLFAAEAHANQRRKGAAQEPYINHLLEVLDLVAGAAGDAGPDEDTLIAAVLHDAVEDTPLTYEGLAERFGERVAGIVRENSDDMTLPKDERRRLRIAGMAHKSGAARLVKIADVISNLRAIAASPPAGWTADRKLGYLEGCRQLVDAGRGASAALEAEFDRTAAAVERLVREDIEAGPDSTAHATRQLENAIGQPVFLLYLPNTEGSGLGPEAVEKLAGLIARSFPSATIEEAQAIFEGRLRPILLARIRTDSTEAVVALAQRVCLAFAQRFVGVEVDGRYIRIYADDTG